MCLCPSADLRKVLTALGAFLAFSGLFWALQGAGIIMWPASSFMLADRNWITYGLLTAAVGGVFVWLGRRWRV